MFDKLCYLKLIKDEVVFFKDRTKAFDLSNIKAWKTIKRICLIIILAVMRLVESRYNIDNILVSILLLLPIDCILLNIVINAVLLFSKKSFNELTVNPKVKKKK